MRDSLAIFDRIYTKHMTLFRTISNNYTTLFCGFVLQCRQQLNRSYHQSFYKVEENMSKIIKQIVEFNCDICCKSIDDFSPKIEIPVMSYSNDDYSAHIEISPIFYDAFGDEHEHVCKSCFIRYVKKWIEREGR